MKELKNIILGDRSDENWYMRETLKDVIEIKKRTINVDGMLE